MISKAEEALLIHLHQATMNAPTSPEKWLPQLREEGRVVLEAEEFVIHAEEEVPAGRVQ